MKDVPDDYAHVTGGDAAGQGGRRARSRRWIWIALVMIVAGGGAWWFVGRPAPAPPPTAGRSGPPPVEVTVAAVERREAAISVASVGTVQPIKSVQISPLVEGPITKVAFEDGQSVKAGDVLFQIDPRPYEAALAQARGQAQSNDASLASARQDFDRTSRLAQNGYAARQTLDQQRQRVAQLQAERKTEEGRIAQAQIALERTTIRAPISGRLSAAQQTEGNVVRPGQSGALTTIIQIAPIDVQFTLPQDQLQTVKLRSADGPLDVAAMTPDGGTEVARGKLVFIDNRIDPTTGTVAMKARFENADGELWPGQFVNVSLTVERRTNAVIVDSRAVQTGPNGRYVFVVRDGKAEMKQIELVELQERHGIVAEGLQGGEQVVINGALKLVPGAAVKVREPGGTGTPSRAEGTARP